MKKNIIPERKNVYYLNRLVILIVIAAGLSYGECMAYTKQPKSTRPQQVSYHFDGYIKDYLDGITENWLKTAPDRNPAIFEMFADRQKEPPRDLLPWSGEFAGKYLTGAVQILRLTGDNDLKNYLANFVNRLISLQANDGYLGPWSKEYQLTGTGPEGHIWANIPTWDAWSHYHIMTGLLLWYEYSGDEKALESAKKIGDLMCNTFLGQPGGMTVMKACAVNHAPVHSLAMLYKKTKIQRYLDLAVQIVEDEFPQEGDYLRLSIAGKEMFEFPHKADSDFRRWENLHIIMGLVEMFWITGNEDYRQAFEHIWWSIVEHDRHNTGGYSTNEAAVGNPYAIGAIETCCVIAWNAMTVEMLRLTGNSVVADELELTFINSIMGYQDPSGKWCTYHTPMDGVRIPSTTAIAFQKRPGSEELNCCSVNAPRGFGLVSEWAFMKDDEGLIINWYGPSTISTKIDNIAVSFQQQTDYPRTGAIKLIVNPEKAVDFSLKLRIPHWSKKSTVTVNGKTVNRVSAGSYLPISRKWKPGDIVKIELDMSLHYWVGEKEYEGKTSIYQGPILLTLNQPDNINFSPHWKRFGELFASKDIGAKLDYSFEGERIVWLGNKFDDAGLAQVIIDGKEVAIVDQYDPVRGQPFRWEYNGLGPGKHTIEIVVTSEKNKDSKDHWINIKAFSLGENETVVDARNPKERLINSDSTTDQIVLLELTAINGKKFTLTDFASAGCNGNRYISWLNVINAPKTPFSTSNPLRSSQTDSK